jgi:excisionase family DNA binding protein
MTYTDWESVPLLLTTEEVAELLRVHENTVRQLIASGKLPATKVGRAWRVKKADVQAYLKANGG